VPLVPIKFKQDLHQAKLNLEDSLSDFQRRLTSLDFGITLIPSSDPIAEEVDYPDVRRASAVETLDSMLGDRDHFRLAFYMTALLDLAEDVLALLVVVIDVAGQAESKRWMIPSLDLLWGSAETPDMQLPGDPGESKQENWPYLC
jgi:hypothetical protein